MAGKTRVIILFGGRSAEHEVSLLSARNVLLSLDRTRFEPALVSIDKAGVWRREPEATLLGATGDPRTLALAAPAPNSEIAVPVRPLSEGAAIDVPANRSLVLGREDVVFPVLHGTYGEDGTVQGLFELADVAYVGSGHLGSAVGMDKDVSKRLLAQAGIPVVPWRLVRAHEFATRPAVCVSAAAELGFPCFVKPANAGSSVGVSKVTSQEGLVTALRAAFAFDRKVLVESGIDAREIECAVLGNDEPVASVPGEIVVTHADGFYSYDAKYVDPNGSHWQIPADLAPATAAEVRHLALHAFVTLELAGMARVDFFLDRKTGALSLNEVNTLPGFTAISMYPKMWEASGISPQELTSRLIDLAVARRRERRSLKTTVG